jgi:PAS domain S-box-containing protein
LPPLRTFPNWNHYIQLILSGLVVAGGIVFLNITFSNDFSKREPVWADSVRQELAQLETEFFNFSEHLNNVVSGSSSDLAAVRSRFYTLYGQATKLELVYAYWSSKENNDHAQALEAVRAFADATAQFIVADDLVLETALPDLLADADATRPSVHKLINSPEDFITSVVYGGHNVLAATFVKPAILFILLGLVLALGSLVDYLRYLKIQKYEQLRAAEETLTRIDTIVQTSLDGVVVAGGDSSIIAFNTAAESIFGYKAKDVLGKPFGPLIIPGHLLDAHSAGMERARAGGERRVIGKGRVQLDAKHANGCTFPVELALQSVETEQGTIFVAFLRDISTRVNAETELILARDQALATARLRSRFLVTMSHEIRTPLNGLLGNLDLIKNTNLNRKQLSYIEDMETSGALLLQHVSDVLDLTRYDSRNFKLREVPLSLAAFVQSTVDSQSGVAAQNNTIVEWGWIGLPQNWVLADPDVLRHILMNLVGNAVKFTRNGLVKISLQLSEIVDGAAKIIIRISDTGQGIKDDLKPFIFDDFVTGSVAYDRTVGGSGLGLGIVRRSVNAMGGQIDVESKPNVGSTFEVRLTLVATQPVAEDPNAPHDYKIAEPLHVLIVEDNEINRVVTREMLETDGHSTMELQDGASAVELCQNTQFDLILMDISMPVMDGRNATRIIRDGTGVCAQTPILALTANALASEQATFLDAGMNGVLIKPLSLSVLRQTLNELFTKTIGGQVLEEKVSHHAEMRSVLGDVTFDQMRALFLAEAEELNCWLSSGALPALEDISRRCHQTAGSAALFGAHYYRTALNAIKDAADAKNTTEVASGIASLDAVWRQTERAI